MASCGFYYTVNPYLSVGRHLKILLVSMVRMLYYVTRLESARWYYILSIFKVLWSITSHVKKAQELDILFLNIEN